MSQSCSGMPISWLELERYALGESQRASEVQTHLESCLVCTDVMTQIEGDRRDMPALVQMTVNAPAQRWRRNWQWGFALVPIVAILVLLFLRSDQTRIVEQRGAGLKGGDNSITLIREHDGALLDPSYFSAGDRFKVQISCSTQSRYADVVIQQDGQLFYPLTVAEVECGNQVVVPGAFSLHGGPAQICIVFGLVNPPKRQSMPSDAICVDIVPAF